MLVRIRPPGKLPICFRSMPACIAETPRQNRPIAFCPSRSGLTLLYSDSAQAQCLASLFEKDQSIFRPDTSLAGREEFLETMRGTAIRRLDRTSKPDIGETSGNPMKEKKNQTPNTDNRPAPLGHPYIYNTADEA